MAAEAAVYDLWSHQNTLLINKPCRKFMFYESSHEGSHHRLKIYATALRADNFFDIMYQTFESVLSASFATLRLAYICIPSNRPPGPYLDATC